MFHSKIELAVELSPSEQDLILSLFPTGTVIGDSHYFDNYNLPCPIKVKIDMPNGKSQSLVLRKARHGDVIREAKVLGLLLKYGLPVPKVLTSSNDNLSILSLLDGENLQHFSMRSDLALEKAKELLIIAITSLEKISNELERDATPDIIPRYSLMNELDAIKSKEPWCSQHIFRASVASLQPVLAQIATPLVFTNGDNQPANFLTNGSEITGFVDFEKASFRDPLMGITKYPIYDLHPMNRAGFVDMYLNAKGYSKADFASRLALMCLITLQKEIPVRAKDAEEQRCQNRVVHLLTDSIEVLSRAAKDR